MFRKKRFSEVENRLRELIKELDVIHNDITGIRKLSLEEMKKTVIKMEDIRQASIIEYDKLGGIAFNNFFSLALSKIIKLLPYFGLGIIAIYCRLIFIGLYFLYIFYDGLKTAIQEHNQNVKKDIDVQFLYKEIEDRVINYNEILTQRMARENTQIEDDTLRQDNEVMIASNCINLAIDYEIDLDFIPDNIKEIMVIILQDDLGIDESDLKNLIGYAIQKVNHNPVKRGRYN